MTVDVTPLLKRYAQRRIGLLAEQDAVAKQREMLLRLVRRARQTRFGRDHDFGGIHGVEDFQSRVPLRGYEEFWEEYFKDPFPVLEDVSWPGRIPYFALSSGTTKDTTKHIPVSRDMIDSNRQGGLDLLAHHLDLRPDSRVFGGKSFMLGGSTDLKKLAPGVREGDLSGIEARELPWWIKPWHFPPGRLALAEDWEEKIETLAEQSLEVDVRLLSGVPSWLLVLFAKLKEKAGKGDFSLAKIFPNLEILAHGGVNFEPYRERFNRLIKGGRAELREIYPASEGFVAVADRGSGQGMRLIVDHLIFYEFVPVEELDSPNPTRHWLGNAQTGVDYALILSTCAGLFAYKLGDTVRLLNLNPPRLTVTGRTSYFLSAYGEHLEGQEIELAMTEASRALELNVTDFSVGPLYPGNEDEPGGHLFIVEFAAPPPPETIEDLATTMDTILSRENEDYRSHRAKNYGMKPPKILAVPPGSFARWMKHRGRLGGQNKVPRVITDHDKFQALIKFMEP